MTHYPATVRWQLGNSVMQDETDINQDTRPRFELIRKLIVAGAVGAGAILGLTLGLVRLTNWAKGTKVALGSSELGKAAMHSATGGIIASAITHDEIAERMAVQNTDERQHLDARLEPGRDGSTTSPLPAPDNLTAIGPASDEQSGAASNIDEDSTMRTVVRRIENRPDQTGTAPTDRPPKPMR